MIKQNYVNNLVVVQHIINKQMKNVKKHQNYVHQMVKIVLNH